MKLEKTNYKLIFFDLDGTLTPSKNPIEPSTSALLCELLKYKKVVVIGGGSKKQFLEQFLNFLDCEPHELENLYIMPTSGSAFYRYNGDWEKIHEILLDPDEKKKIFEVLPKALKEVGYADPAVTYGDVIEDRGTQITFSALGQNAPLDIKSKWDPDRTKRLPIADKLRAYLPEFTVRLGGTTTIDITKKGIDKAYGVTTATRYLDVDLSEAVYIGDALYDLGNDAIVKETGIATVQVSGPSDTEKIIKELLNHS